MPSSLLMTAISIHAPTRGATFSLVNYASLHTISIHAPTRGATPFMRAGSAPFLFQSTLLQEERP